MKKVILLIFIFIGGGIVVFLCMNRGVDSSVKMKNFRGKYVDEFLNYVKDNDIDYELEYVYDNFYDKDMIISQSIDVGVVVNRGDKCKVIVSSGNVPPQVYKDNKVNELGSVPIMMYHGIVDMASKDTEYIGGNVDKDGYSRTVEAFREDLEFYYKSGYRMIRLEDYIEGNIDVELGKSPIILTFDDGDENNFKVLGEKDGELIIDPNCAIGVLEEFKKKYSDYGVTATFFVNEGLFNQDKYNDKILKWLVKNGYDIGNHTMSHVDFTKIGKEEVSREVGGIYKLLDDIISGEYVEIVALPFGSPYQTSHDNYSLIVDGGDYHTKGILRVGWEAERSCFDKEFNPLFMKRIRAYDNGEKEFDIEMNFKILEGSRYISDGDKNTVVVNKKDVDRTNVGNRKVIGY